MKTSRIKIISAAIVGLLIGIGIAVGITSANRLYSAPSNKIISDTREDGVYLKSPYYGSSFQEKNDKKSSDDYVSVLNYSMLVSSEIREVILKDERIVVDTLSYFGIITSITKSASASVSVRRSDIALANDIMKLMREHRLITKL